MATFFINAGGEIVNAATPFVTEPLKERGNGFKKKIKCWEKLYLKIIFQYIYNLYNFCVGKL